MRDRYLLFSAPMVRGCLAGRKTQTRRIAKDPDRAWGAAGDTLIGRETFRLGKLHDDAPPTAAPVGARLFYEADRDDRIAVPTWAGVLRPAIHQPRWAARIIRPVLDVRFQRLHDLTRDDAIAEGLVGDGRLYGVPGLPLIWNRDPRDTYAALWETINGPGSWARNPPVWAISFERHNR